MTRRLLCVVALLWSATMLQADVFSYSYTGGTVSGRGYITGTSNGAGSYTITDVSGYQNGVSTFLAPGVGPEPNVLFYGPSGSGGDFDFSLNGKNYLLGFAAGIYGEFDSSSISTGLSPALGCFTGMSGCSEVVFGDENNYVVAINQGTFAIRQVPEVDTISLLFAMGFGVWLLGRKLPLKSRL